MADASDNQAVGGNRPQPETLWDRVVRARGIAAERLKEKPTTWPRIAKQFGISRAQAQAIYADFKKWDLRAPDPLVRVDEAIDYLEEMLRKLSYEIEHGDNSNARVGAVRASLDVLRERITLEQADGRMPRNLKRYRADAEFVTIVDEILDSLERRGAGREALEDIQAIVRGHMEGHPGNVVQLRPRATGTDG